MQTKHKKEYYISLIFLLLSVVFWGYSFISTKVILKELPPASIAFFRQIIASATLGIWLLCTKAFSRISLKHMGFIAISALFGIVLYFVFENNGLKFTSASNASMIVASVPVFTLVTEALFYKMKITLKMVICVLLSIAGVYFVISVNGSLDLSSSTLLGNLLVIGAMAAWVIYTMFNKSLTKSYSTNLLTAYQIITSVFIFIPFVIPEVKQWKMLSLMPMLNLIYLGVFCSAFAYFFYVYASKRLGSTVSAAFLNLIPVVSVVSGYLVLGERISLIQAVGMGIVILSLFILNKK